MTDTTRFIGAKASLESLKNEAKRWLKDIRQGDAAALARYQSICRHQVHPPTLREVQQALAREYGFTDWAAVKIHIEDVVMGACSDAERAADFLDLACLHYGVAPGSNACTHYPDGPDRRRRAARILERHPQVARYSLHTAVVSGNLAEVERILATAPHAASLKGGRERWEPLLFLCYGRLPTPEAVDNAVEIATALLDHGADPNAAWSYVWNSDRMAFSAVCGVIGNGERGNIVYAPHPHAERLASLLLQRGAHPNQAQALYNTMLQGDDTTWLRLLVSYGLGPDHRIPWPGDGSSPATTFEYLLAHAAQNNQLARARFLLDHGARPTPTKGESFYTRALRDGHAEMAELLVRHGSLRTALTEADAFRAACAQVDHAAATRLLAQNPSFMKEAQDLMVGLVAKDDRTDVARLLLDLGVSPDAEMRGPGGGYRALHQAASSGAVRVAELLIQRGADVDARDTEHHATPLAFALHAHRESTIELLSGHTRDIFTLVASGRLSHLRKRLTEELCDPWLANANTRARLGLGRFTAEPGDTPLFVLPNDEDLAIEVADVLLAHGADKGARNDAGETPADRARARGLEGVAEWLSVS